MPRPHRGATDLGAPRATPSIALALRSAPFELTNHAANLPTRWLSYLAAPCCTGLVLFLLLRAGVFLSQPPDPRVVEELAHAPALHSSACVTSNSTRQDVVKCCMGQAKAHPAAQLAACSINDYAPPEESKRTCAVLPPWAVQRAVTLRQASSELGRRLRAATVARPLVVAAIGGSVSAGHGGRSWLEYMKDEYFREAWGTDWRHRLDSRRIQFYKQATNAMGPSYMARCLPRHIAALGGRLPDVVIAEYAVNDFGAMRGHDDIHKPVDMQHLARLLADLGIALILLHHFSPAFLMGGSTYKANRPRPL